MDPDYQEKKKVNTPKKPEDPFKSAAPIIEQAEQIVKIKGKKNRKKTQINTEVGPITPKNAHPKGKHVVPRKRRKRRQQRRNN